MRIFVDCTFCHRVRASLSYRKNLMEFLCDLQELEDFTHMFLSCKLLRVKNIYRMYLWMSVNTDKSI